MSEKTWASMVQKTADLPMKDNSVKVYQKGPQLRTDLNPSPRLRQPTEKSEALHQVRTQYLDSLKLEKDRLDEFFTNYQKPFYVIKERVFGQYAAPDGSTVPYDEIWDGDHKYKFSKDFFFQTSSFRSELFKYYKSIGYFTKIHKDLKRHSKDTPFLWRITIQKDKYADENSK